jgi:hypothetical protein
MHDFDELVRRERAGELVVGIDRDFARKFFTDLKLAQVEASIGERPYIQKAIVMAAFVGGPLTFLVASVLAARATGWWAVLTIAAALMMWLSSYAAALRGAGLQLTTTVLVAGVVAYAVVGGNASRYWAIGVMYASSLWCPHIMFRVATFFVRGLVLGNQGV